VLQKIHSSSRAFTQAKDRVSDPGRARDQDHRAESEVLLGLTAAFPAAVVAEPAPQAEEVAAQVALVDPVPAKR
jgi:hypothetical protein